MWEFVADARVVETGLRQEVVLLKALQPTVCTVSDLEAKFLSEALQTWMLCGHAFVDFGSFEFRLTEDDLFSAPSTNAEHQGLPASLT